MTSTVDLAGATPTPLPANRPLHLDDPGTAWLLESGRVQVFAVRPGGRSARLPLFTVGSGELLLPPPAGGDVELIAVGLVDDTAAHPVPLEHVRAAAGGADPGHVAQLLDEWLGQLAATLERSLPDEGLSLAPGELARIPAGALAWPATRIVWLHNDANLVLFGEQTGTPPTNALCPVPPQAWVGALDDVETTPLSTLDALADPDVWRGIDAFQRALLVRVARVLDGMDGAAGAELDERRSYEDELRTATYTGLGAVLGGEVATVTPGIEAGLVLGALRVVGAAQQIDVKPAPRGAVGATTDPVDTIARASGVRSRKVVPEGEWWKTDVGPFLAFRSEDEHPVAILPAGRRGYVIVDPAEGTRVPVTVESASTLADEGYMLYRALPSHPLTGRDLISFMWRPIRRDVAWLAVFGVFVAGISLLTPVVTKVIFSRVVPGLQRSNLAWLTVLLVVFAFATLGFSLAQQIAFLRLQGRAATDVQAALWDRVLDLPLPFFRKYSAGSLAMRVMGIERIRLYATGAVVTAVLAIPVGIANLALAFVLNVRLGIFGAVGIVFIGAVMVLLIRFQVPRERRVQEATSELFGISMQLVEAAGKLRVADAERRGFAEWGKRFADLKRSFYDAQVGFAGATAVVASAPALGTLLLFLGAATLKTGAISGATFLAFNTAFIQALAAVTGLTNVATFLAQSVPLYENTRPILGAERETDVVKADPGELRGQIEMSHVSFRYAEDSPLVLDDFGFSAEPGEFVAFVGPSGAGKSSVMRVLLGFENAEVGTVRYDGKDIESLDPRALRRQMGVVVQSARLMPGDIFTNIVGARPLTVEDAWAAAEIAGIKEDIEALPMGMHTFVAEGMGAFSGGQKQRLLIARAVVGRPRILLFDEATSALDNRTQAAVSQAIEHLRATRVVIAHRLSTVRNADRIVVVQAGKVAQQGTYDELMAVEGPFRLLAQRQLA
ncbi:MAG TPA: NHLP bacteriocin export ABC transporter permease/ATPase subunit [Gaiellaceae bacterium]